TIVGAIVANRERPRRRHQPGTTISLQGGPSYADRDRLFRSITPPEPVPRIVLPDTGPETVRRPSRSASGFPASRTRVPHRERGGIRGRAPCSASPPRSAPTPPA